MLTIASLQFWTADLGLITLRFAQKKSIQHSSIQHQPIYSMSATWHDILFSCFVTTLNAAFEWKLAQEDEGYESSSETINMPTPLRKMPRIHHISSIDHALFDPNLLTPYSTFCTPPRPVCRQLMFSLSNDSDTPEDTPPAPRATPAVAQVYLEEENEEEDFQMVPLDDKHWTTEEVPDRTLYIHRSIPYCVGYAHIHALMQITYSLPTLTVLDLSDISNFKDIMITSSDKDVPALEDAPY